MTAILFISFIVLIVIGVPISVALGVASILAILSGMDVSLIVTSQTMFNGVNSFPLMAVPFFVLAGNLMGEGGISTKLIQFVNLFFARVRGGLSIVAIGASMIFAAISGSCPATTAAIGGIMVPEMEKSGYSKQFSAATVAAAGTVGQVIPPSIPMVTYCVLANASVGDLFLAGVLPGILMGSIMMVVAYIYAIKNNVPKVSEKISAKQFVTTLLDSIWAIIMPVIILGGIYSGVFTPTEAGAIACVYSLVIGIFVYKELKIQDISKVFCKSAVASAVIMLIMGTVSTFSFVLTRERIPQLIATELLSITSNKYILLLLFDILLLIVGCFLNSSAAIALLTPILLPVLTSVGINPYHIGIIFIVVMGIGMVTPPVGTCLYVAANISKLKFEEVVSGVMPYLIGLMVAMIIITYCEPLSLGLINLMR
ncbi:MAG: TRAP transporter large permease [Lachnospiraceae bacterium]|nr:TRAP transporter large permease [Lachnospiraceae bacterium]